MNVSPGVKKSLAEIYPYPQDGRLHRRFPRVNRLGIEPVYA